MNPLKQRPGKEVGSIDTGGVKTPKSELKDQVLP
jgi:hypothetical protein